MDKDLLKRLQEAGKTSASQALEQKINADAKKLEWMPFEYLHQYDDKVGLSVGQPGNLFEDSWEEAESDLKELGALEISFKFIETTIYEDEGRRWGGKPFVIIVDGNGKERRVDNPGEWWAEEE